MAVLRKRNVYMMSPLPISLPPLPLSLPLSLSSTSQKADESFGMNVAGGTGGTAGDLPIFISAIKQDSVIGCCGKIQVSECTCTSYCYKTVV